MADNRESSRFFLLRDLGNLLVPVGGYFGLAALAPPTDLDQYPQVITPIVVIVSYFIGFLLARRWGLLMRTRQQLKHLTLLAASSFLLLALSIIGYVSLWEKYTADFIGERRWVGSELTPQGKRYFEIHPHSSQENVLVDATGRSEDIWTTESLEERKRLLWGLFILFIFISISSCTLGLYTFEAAVKPNSSKRDRASSSSPD